MTDNLSKPAPPISALPYVEPAVDLRKCADGSFILTSPHAPGNPPRSIGHLLEERAAAHPDRPLILQRGADRAWEGLSYGEMLSKAKGVGQWLLEHGIAASGGVMILSGNSVAHAVMMVGALLSGVKTTALSQAFSAQTSDRKKLHHCFELIGPKLIFVQRAADYSNALAGLREIDPDILVVSEIGDEGCFRLDEIAATPPGAALAAAFDALDHDTVAKYLFTSGSTGMPKAVPQTHGMMAAMIAARAGLVGAGEIPVPPAAIDWMPWSHLSAGNIGFNHNIWTGGTLYLDDGRPVRGAFDETLANFIELQPMSFSSAPIAFEMLATALEASPDAARAFFVNLQWMAYGGAALSQEVCDRLQRLAIAHAGHRIPITTTYGATEVQGITAVYWPSDRVGNLGLPLPGVSIKLAPIADKYEVRVKGATVMRGYLNDEAKNAEAFDEDGYYCLGDAARLIDEADPLQGIAFAGRISEDFKLSSGTWVSVGTLRTAALEAASPHLLDMVITGQDKRFVGALAWQAPESAADPQAREQLRAALIAFNAAQGGSSRRIARLLLLDTPPSIRDGEVTEKGYINQRMVLSRRADEVARLHATDPDPDLLVVEA